MALRELLAALEAGAEREREQVLADARVRAEEIRRDAAARRARRRAEVMSEVEAEEESAARQTVTRARIEARQSVLDEQENLLARVRRAMEERIAASANDDAYRIALQDEVRDAARRIEAGSIEARTAPGLVDPVRAALESGSADGDVDVREDASLPSGYVLVSADGAREIDGTLEAKLEQTWPRLAVSILREAES